MASGDLIAVAYWTKVLLEFLFWQSLEPGIANVDRTLVFGIAGEKREAKFKSQGKELSLFWLIMNGHILFPLSCLPVFVCLFIIPFVSCYRIGLSLEVKSHFLFAAFYVYRKTSSRSAYGHGPFWSVFEEHRLDSTTTDITTALFIL